MAHIVTEPCVNCKYTDCVEVCAVNCFYEAGDRLYINPDECTDCRACIPVCPVGAIFLDADVPEKWKTFIELNRVATTGPDKAKYPNITERKEPLAAAGNASEKLVVPSAPSLSPP